MYVIYIYIYIHTYMCIYIYIYTYSCLGRRVRWPRYPPALWPERGLRTSAWQSIDALCVAMVSVLVSASVRVSVIGINIAYRY